MIARSTPVGVNLGGTVQTAAIVTEGNRTWCHCPTCKQKLGEIAGDRLVIAKGPVRIIVSLRSEPELVCWRCNETVTVQSEHSILRTA